MPRRGFLQVVLGACATVFAFARKLLRAHSQQSQRISCHCGSLSRYQNPDLYPGTPYRFEPKTGLYTFVVSVDYWVTPAVCVFCGGHERHRPVKEECQCKSRKALEARLGNYGTFICEGGMSGIVVCFCPSCGGKIG